LPFRFRIGARTHATNSSMSIVRWDMLALHTKCSRKRRHVPASQAHHTVSGANSRPTLRFVRRS
jgi:hypothetical protein